MKHYLTMAKKYLSAHPKNTRLTIFSVIISVALIVGIFSLLDSLVEYEKAQVLKTEGNYHILIRNANKEEIDYISSRIDVENSGTLKDLGLGRLNDQECSLSSLDENFLENLNITMIAGKYPHAENEIMLEKWVMENAKLKIGDPVKITLSDSANKQFVISGSFEDWGASKAAGTPIVLVSADASQKITPKSSQHFILFKDGVQIIKAEESIHKVLNLADKRLARNEGLLALMLETKNNKVLKMYAIGVILFCLVLATAVIMIFNTFNISIMERVRHFGLLRCLGASPSQIRKLVRKEGLLIAFQAIPFGVIAGMIFNIICSLILKFYNRKLFGDIPYINVSVIGIGAGIVIGYLAVFIASLIPAKKASRVAPINAVKGSDDIKISKKEKQGFLLKMFSADLAMGINNAFLKKKTLFLMTSSLALSIIIFLGFNVLVNPKYIGMRPIKPYTADLTIISEEGISNEVLEELSSVTGIKELHGRMTSYIQATFQADKVTEEYRREVGDIKTTENGFLQNPEKSGIISYDQIQLKWARDYLTAGVLTATKLNQAGLIVIRKIPREDSLIKTTSLQLGDLVYIKTPKGRKELKIMGIIDSAPYSCQDPTLTTFIITEKLFREITQETMYKEVDIKLLGQNQEATVQQIRKLVSQKFTLQDKRQMNQESHNAYMTIAVFIYGFIGVIALISILNIINLMTTSVAAKTKYLGVMRAIGMTGDQLNKLVLAESLVYCLGGCIVGCIFGSLLQRVLLDFFAEDWRFPFVQIIFIFTVSLLTAMLSVITPLKKIKAQGIAKIVAN